MIERKNPEDYPMPRRNVGYEEVISYTKILAEKAKHATQIVGVARSGMPFATWIAQMNKVELGYYNPKYNICSIVPQNNQHLFFVDETSERGETQQKIHAYMQQHMPNTTYEVESVFIDYFHPNKNNAIYAKCLDFWCDGIAGVCKNIDVNEQQWRDV